MQSIKIISFLFALFFTLTCHGSPNNLLQCPSPDSLHETIKDVTGADHLIVKDENQNIIWFQEFIADSGPTTLPLKELLSMDAINVYKNSNVLGKIDCVYHDATGKNVGLIHSFPGMWDLYLPISQDAWKMTEGSGSCIPATGKNCTLRPAHHGTSLSINLICPDGSPLVINDSDGWMGVYLFQGRDQEWSFIRLDNKGNTWVDFPRGRLQIGAPSLLKSYYGHNYCVKTPGLLRADFKLYEGVTVKMMPGQF